MKKLIVILVGIGLLGFFACQQDGSVAPTNENSAANNSLDKPAPQLEGIVLTDFSFDTPPNFWNGTIDFGETGLFAITFISYEPPREYSNASPFYEDFIIFELGTDWQDPANVYLKGWNKGVTTLGKEALDPAKFVANGKVDEAYGPLDGWQGCTAHFRGTFTWVAEGVPDVATGTLRIN